MGISLGELRRLFYCPPCPSISSAKPAFLPPNPPTPSLCTSGAAQGHRPERPPRLQPLPLQTKEGPAQIPEFAACTERARARLAAPAARGGRGRGVLRAPGQARPAGLQVGGPPALQPLRAALLPRGRGGPGPDVSFHVGLGSRIRCSVWDSSVYGLSPASPPEPPCRPAGTAPWAGPQSRELRPLQAEPGTAVAGDSASRGRARSSSAAPWRPLCAWPVRTPGRLTASWPSQHRGDFRSPLTCGSFWGEHEVLGLSHGLAVCER
nr:alpha/beta hydrolase domain-containing protein 17C-like [Oryctolagus cuniculus]